LRIGTEALGGHTNIKDRPVSANLTPIPFAGRAVFRGGTLRIEGRARYPNDFSTATLQPLVDMPLASSTCRAFAVVFHRDKEPYCGPDLIGPVVYSSEAEGLAKVEVVRVYVAPGSYEDIRVER
jgi:hypothetical protein